MPDGTCSAEGCSGKTLARGWCNKHYIRWRSYGDPLYERPRPTVCAAEDCGRPLPDPKGARGLCGKHYQRWRVHGDPDAAGCCQGCGSKIRISSRFCMTNPECRRLAKAYQRTKDPERTRARNARWEAENPEKKRANHARYRARADRPCVRLECTRYALIGSPYCRPHKIEAAKRRYARTKLLIHERLYEYQGGMCPDADHGGCGKLLRSTNGNHVDHVIPEVRNGPDEDWNLQLMHPGCNQRKSDNIVPAALVLAEQHGVTLSRPDGSRPRKKAA